MNAYNPAASYDYGVALARREPTTYLPYLDNGTAMIGWLEANGEDQDLTLADLEDDSRECARCTCALPRANAECPMCGYQP
jgi:hypothetical protein